MCKRTLLLVAAMTLILAASPALGQGTTTGILEGQVRGNDGNPLAEALVTVTGPQGARTAITGANGRYQFRDLIPGKYAVRAECDGHATIVQTEVDIMLARRTQLPFMLTEGITETVTVTSEAPMVDLKTTTVGTVVSVDDLVQYIPLGRNFADMFTLSPGVTSGLQSGAGNYSVSGSSGLENSYLIDGVNITNSGYGGIGSYNRVFGSLGSGVTNDFIEQVEVKEGGFEAEYGQATGGVINAIVKSGTNTFSGQASLYAAPDSLETGRTVLRRHPDAITIEEESRQELAVSLGGPIIKDRLFWYGAYNPSSRKRHSSGPCSTRRRCISDPTSASSRRPDAPMASNCIPTRSAPGRTAAPSTRSSSKRAAPRRATGPTTTTPPSSRGW